MFSISQYKLAVVILGQVRELAEMASANKPNYRRLRRAWNSHFVHDISSNARRILIFLSPSGNDSVMLTEDVNRKITLDCLEIQYYR